jgi:ABC-type nitrate/sulfonate/bicarbonate transport system substrate-binding protein
MSRFLRLPLIWLTICLITVNAFGWSTDRARAQAVPKQVGSVSLGWVKSTANLLAFVAPKMSEKHGLKIEPANFNTAVDISTAMISGQIDIGLLTPIHLIRALEMNIDFVQISGNTRGNTGIVIAKKYGLKDDDWDGFKRLIAQKKLKVASSRGSINELLAIAEFSKHGVNVDKDLDLVNIANFGQHPQALRSGDFDIIVSLEPLVSLSVSEGTGTLFSRPYGSLAGDLNTNYVVQRDWLEKNRDKAQAFVAVLKDAAAQLGSDKATELKAAVDLTGMKPDTLTMALANSRYDLRNSLAEMQQLAKLAVERKYTSRDVSSALPSHVDDRFLTAAGVSR